MSGENPNLATLLFFFFLNIFGEQKAGTGQGCIPRMPNNTLAVEVKLEI